MKILTKLSLFILAMVFAVNVNAQLLPVSLGIKGGVNTSTINGDGTKAKAGYNVGLTLDVNLPANFAIMSGLELTTKGSKFKSSYGEENNHLKSIGATYLQLPVHLGYRIKLVPGITAHFDFGPYFAQGIGGKTKGVFEGKDYKVNTFGDDALKRFDWGLGVGVGFTFVGKIQARVGYDHGLSNIGNDDFKVRNRNAFLTVGYRFF